MPTTACAFHGDTSTSSSTLHGTYSIVCCARSSRTQPQACSSSTLTCTLLRFFIQTLCRSGPIPRRVFWGGCPCYFLRGKRYFGVCATTFSANRAGICTHVAGQAAYIQGKRRAKKIHYRHTRRVGRSYVALRSVLLFWGFFIGNIGVASKGSVLLRFRPQPSNLGSILGTNLSSKQN